MDFILMLECSVKCLGSFAENINQMTGNKFTGKQDSLGRV